ncbi:MAG: T9SS type A sorting domain-containing protein [Saprospiraceae bacterium]
MNKGQSQITFQNTYGSINGNQGNTVILTNSGGYAIAGWYDVESLFTAEFYLLVLDAEGDTLWTRTYGAAIDTSANFGANGSGNEGFSLIQTSDDGFLFIGERHDTQASPSDAYAIKIAADGDLEWARLYGGFDDEYGYAVAESDNGDYAIGGFTETAGAGPRNMLLIKTNNFGDTLWTKIYGGSSIDAATDMQQTIDGGYILSGNSFSFGAGDSDMYVVRTDEDGNILWQKTFGGELNDICHAIARTEDGGFILCGESQNFGEGDTDIYLVKIDSNGNLQWSKTYGGEGKEAGNSVSQTSDGGYIIAGYTREFGSGGEDFYLIRTNAQGEMLWAKTIGGTEDDAAQSVKQAADGGYIITGYTRSFGAGFLDIYLVKTDSNGDSGDCTSFANQTIENDAATIETVAESIVVQGLELKQRPTLMGFTNTIITSDNCFKVSTHNNNTLTFSISPNPTTDVLHIIPNTDRLIKGQNISIYNYLGQTVMTFAESDNQQINVSQLPPGIFVLTLEIEEQLHTYKFVKQ